MKFFQHITDEEDCLESYSFLGLTLFERATVNYKRARIWSNKPLKKMYKRFIGRIVYKAKYYNVNGLFKREITLFSIPIIGTLKLNGYKLYFILGIKVYSKPLKFLSDFEAECLKELDKRYDDIYIILHHLGDAFRMLTLIKEIIKNRQSKNPLIMVFDDSFEDLVRMMNLGVPYIKIQTTKPFKKRMETQFSKDEFSYGGYRFYLLWNNWWSNVKYPKINKSLPVGTHSIDVQAAAQNVSYDGHSMGKISILKDKEKTMLEKSYQAGLNLENFIFIAPESFALAMYSDNFWEELTRSLQSSGYDIFVNTVSCKEVMMKNSYANNKSRVTNIDNLDNVKSFFLTVGEAYALACKAKKIITARSGFSEMLVQTEVPLCVIYTGANLENVERIKKTGTVMMSPFASPNKIKEINVVGMSVNDSIKAVTEALDIKICRTYKNNFSL